MKIIYATIEINENNIVESKTLILNEQIKILTCSNIRNNTMDTILIKLKRKIN